MQKFKLLGTALTAALVLAACGGGGGDGNQAPAVAYTSVVSFGDSLSDAGSYAVPYITTLIGKGKGAGMFTVNGIAGAIGDATPPSYTWAQLIAAQAVGKANCAAWVGGFTTTPAHVAGCTNYAQGGARVTDPQGTNNPVGAGFIAGPTTVPVVTQVQNYLTDLNNGGKFSGKELVTVLAGANDILAQTAKLKADATAAGSAAFLQSLVTQLAAGATDPTAAATAIYAAIAALPSGSSTTTVVSTAVGTAAVQPGNSAVASPTVYGPMVTTAQTAGTTAANTYAATTGATAAVTGMVTAATQLVASVKGMVANGATHIVVANLPDVSKTPMALAQATSSQQLILAMTTAFNNALATGLANTAGVLVVDVFSEHQREIKDPAHFALTNVTDTVCDSSNASTRVNPADATTFSSLVCNTTNVIAGDTTHYMFADDLHPTPYEHKLLAQYVAKALVIAGWL